MGSESLNNMNQDGCVDQEAGIEILCVKHTHLVVAEAAVHRVKLGTKEIDGLKWAGAEMWAAENTQVCCNLVFS